MENQATVSYIKKTNNKSRLITTYTKNDLGKKLRIYHKVQMQYITNFLPPTDFCFAYTKNKSTFDMVKKHLNSKFFLYIDIKSFFSSIDINLLKKNVEFLCSKNMPQNKLYELIDSCKIKKQEGIAIGLIPSAFLSNVYLKDFDKNINAFLQSIDKNFKYSRYSDDIVISNSNNFDFNFIKHEISKNLADLNLKIHTSKSRFKVLENYSDHIKILGLNIVKGKDENYISVSRKFKKNMKKTKNYLSKKGKQNYILHNEYNK